jgi:hypothetical protein
LIWAPGVSSPSFFLIALELIEGETSEIKTIIFHAIPILALSLVFLIVFGLLKFACETWLAKQESRLSRTHPTQSAVTPKEAQSVVDLETEVNSAAGVIRGK